MTTGSTILITFLFITLLVSIIVWLSLYEIRQSEKESIQQQIVGVQENFMRLMGNINSYFSKKPKLNSEYHKNELVSILELVDEELVTTEKYTNENLDLLLANRDLIVGKFLNWTMVYNTSEEIIKEKDNLHLLQNKLTSEFNNACSKCCHINAKFKTMSGYLDFVTERKFYEDNYFSKLIYLLELSYSSLEEGNFIKAFNLKQAYDAFYTELFKVLKGPAEFLQRIHDAKYEIQLLEDELSNHLVGKRYKKILAKLDVKKVKDDTFDRFDKLRIERQNYLTTLKWCDDDIAKQNNLKKLKMMMVNLENLIDKDIRESDNKEKDNNADKIKLSRAANVIEGEAKLTGSYKDIFHNLFDDITF